MKQKLLRDKSRILYEINEHADDSVVPADFLSNMTINDSLMHYSLYNVLNITLPVIHQSLIVISFLSVQYNTLMIESGNAESLFALSDTGNAADNNGYHLNIYYLMIVLFSLLLNFSRFIILSLFVYNLSPVIQTLTITFSSDTIWITSILFFVIHLFTFDYAYFVQNDLQSICPIADGNKMEKVTSDESKLEENKKQEQQADKPLNGAVSLSCLFIPLILLGSRCTDSLQFFQLYLNVHFLFLGILPFRRFLYYKTFQYTWFSILQWLVIIVHAIISICTIYNIETPVLAIWRRYIGTNEQVIMLFSKASWVSIVFIVLSAIMFWYMHIHHKRLISGSWDEAKLNIEYTNDNGDALIMY